MAYGLKASNCDPLIDILRVIIYITELFTNKPIKWLAFD